MKRAILLVAFLSTCNICLFADVSASVSPKTQNVSITDPSATAQALSAPVTVVGAPLPAQQQVVNVLKPNNTITLRVIGQGLAPESAQSKYQALALAKRAAIADGYRLLVEKLYGVRIEGKDYVKNMVMQKSEVRACVSAVIRYVDITETKCADNFCEVELELKIRGNDWYYQLAGAGSY